MSVSSQFFDVCHIMSNEQGQKRLLSPESNTNPNTEDKRRCNDSLEIDEIAPSQVENMEQEITLLDLKKLLDGVIVQLKDTAKADDLLNLASKQDIKEIDDRVTAQSQEINQLRTQMSTLQNNFNSLQSTVDGQLAANMARGSGSVGPDPTFEPGRTTTNMAATGAYGPQSSPSRRRNLVFEGLKGGDDMEIKAAVIDVASAIGVKVYGEEIESVFRMPRRDERNVKPGPVLVTLSRIVIRDSILKKKSDLFKCAGMEQVFVNADESIEVRRAKSFLRKASYNARRQGEMVLFKHNQVTINGTIYTTQDVNKIPDKYLHSNEDDEGNKADQAVAMEVPADNETTKSKEGLIRKGEQMRITRKGLCFSGPSSYLSNMAYVDVKVGDKNFVSNEQRYNKNFVSNEQRYQWEKAIEHKDDELAKEIKGTRNSYEVKSAGGLITASTEWLDNAPVRLDVMVIDKFEQHPELLERSNLGQQR